MSIKLVLFYFLFVAFFMVSAQDSNLKKFRILSGPEKCWVIFHPFIAKKVLIISEKARVITKEVLLRMVLEGSGDGDQIDAFRHAFWMASLAQEIGKRRARCLGEKHEKGNYKDYKQRRFEDGVIPDKISSEMDLFNNEIGFEIGIKYTGLDLKSRVVEAVLNGDCKVVRKDITDNFIDCEGNLIPIENLKGKWENNKCLVWSNE